VTLDPAFASNRFVYTATFREGTGPPPAAPAPPANPPAPSLGTPLPAPRGERLIRMRVRARRGVTERRLRVRLGVSAVLPGGRRVEATRRIVLIPRR